MAPMPSLVPSLPTGQPVGAYDSYEQAQRAVDHLSDEKFPVEQVAIVGTDLRMVERVTGRLTWLRAGAAGAASGAWFGLLVGLLLSLFSDGAEGVLGLVLTGLLVGALFGLVFGLVSYALSGGRRDFTSTKQVLAGRYEVLCQHQHAERARELLARLSLRA